MGLMLNNSTVDASSRPSDWPDLRGQVVEQDSPLGGKAAGEGDQFQPGPPQVQMAPDPKTGVMRPTMMDPKYGDLGPNMELLKDKAPELVNALWRLTEEYRIEAIVGRRHEIRRIRQARLFWQGIQQGYYDKDSGLWQLPFGSSLGLGVALDSDSDQSEQPRYSFVTNYYLAFGLAFAAIISQDVPTVRWWPRKPSSAVDVTAAKSASEASELIEQNNKIQDKLTELGYYLWTDGKIGGFVRYVVDGEQFGFDEREDLEETYAKLGEDAYICPNCGTENPVESQQQTGDQNQNLGQQPGTLSAPPPQSNVAAAFGMSLVSADGSGGVCQACGGPLTQDDFKTAELVPVPKVQQVNQVPRGQEVITIVGGLELNTPVWAREQRQFPYLQWQLEVHRAKLKASYPHVADKLESQYPSGADDVYARASRLSVAQGLPFTHPGDALYTLITFNRTWIRRWALYDLKKEWRDEALRIFPKGPYIAFAGDVYCEARSESMDDRWRTTNAYPGEGQSRPSVGDPLIDVQEQYNSYSNIMAENFEYGIPPIYVEPETLDLDALPNTTVEPASMYPARSKAGQPLEASFYQPDPSKVSPDMAVYMQELMGPIAQMLTGLFPAVFGGQMEDIKTAKAYAMARDQALGRLGLVWRRVKEFYAQLMLLAVDCFRQNRPEDVEIPILTETGDVDYKMIMMADLKGNIEAYSEPDETFPRLKSDQRAVVQQLMQSDDPEVAEMLAHPSNVGLIKGLLGLTDFVIPDEDSRNKQLREIEELLESPPIMTGQPDPLTGQVVPQLVSTVDVDPVLDNSPVEFAECVRWANGPDGIKAKKQNPAGFANVRVHAMKHQQVMQQQAMQQMVQQAALAGGGPNKEEGGGKPGKGGPPKPPQPQA